ncbi:transposase [Leifsonia xyli subsp. xyli str. CTCB07]|uniref:Transposase n=1 Tax=Leifsonia xyli subsp. xyli (strain CTCB07) TaxID=281090 RepID=Q6ACI7_LEIXX|nr:transposase [Leifsonia xyli subsp. xyli str. CTCB07]
MLTEAGTQIALSTYYAAKGRPPSARAVRDAGLTKDIRVVHKANLGVLRRPEGPRRPEA